MKAEFIKIVGLMMLWLSKLEVFLTDDFT